MRADGARLARGAVAGLVVLMILFASAMLSPAAAHAAPDADRHSAAAHQLRHEVARQAPADGRQDMPCEGHGAAHGTACCVGGACGTPAGWLPAGEMAGLPIVRRGHAHPAPAAPDPDDSDPDLILPPPRPIV